MVPIISVLKFTASNHVILPTHVSGREQVGPFHDNLFCDSRVELKKLMKFVCYFSEEVSSSAISDPQSCKKGTRFHNETLGCWPLKKQGPCPPSMIFYAIDKKFGDCDCPDLYPGLDPVWVYDIASNQCFRTYQQVPFPNFFNSIAT